MDHALYINSLLAEYGLLVIAFAAALWALIGGWRATRRTADASLPLPPESLDFSYFSLETGWVSRPLAEMTDPSDTEAAMKALQAANERRPEILRDPQTGLPQLVLRSADEWTQELGPEESVSDLRGPQPLLSVVVYAFDPRFDIRETIHNFSTQRTSFRYELIVVCDSSAQEAAALVEQIGPVRGVHLTFIPPGSHNLSRRKLAFTVGMKAARGEVVLLTVSNVVAPSLNWFQLMGAPTLKALEKNQEPPVLTAGVSQTDLTGMNPLTRRYRSFLMQMQRCRAVGAVIGGRPYRADWLNMAVNRKAFFENKGYRSSLYLETGDDDLFVCELAERGSSEMVLSPMAMPREDWGESAVRVWKEQMESYSFTSRWLPRGAFIAAGALSACQWVMFLSLAALWALFFWGGVSPERAWINPAIGSGMWVAFEALQVMIYRRAAARLMMPKLLLLLPLFLLWRPIGNFLFSMNHKSSSRRNFTWRRN